VSAHEWADVLEFVVGMWALALAVSTAVFAVAWLVQRWRR
jgi:hypothetical protein